MRLYFTFSECCMTDQPIPQRIAENILDHHIMPQSIMREELGFPIYVNGSCWRSDEHEKQKGRNPLTTEHTFKINADRNSEGWGAFDGHTHPVAMLRYAEIALQSPYRRICYYPDKKFFHFDYRFPNRGLALFVSEQGNWRQKSRTDWLKTIKNSL